MLRSQGPKPINDQLPSWCRSRPVERLIRRRIVASCKSCSSRFGGNQPGAGSMIGTGFVAKAPDGYTPAYGAGAVLAKWLNKNVAFDVTSALSPIALFAKSPLVLFAHSSAAFSDLNELITYSKAYPGRLSVGIPGVGTPHHLAAAWLNKAANIDIRHVPYRAVPPALNDLLAGQIPLIWGAPASVMPFVEQGKVKMLAVSTQERDPLLPQVPTVSESGVTAFDIANWFGIAAPARCRRQ